MYLLLFKTKANKLPNSEYVHSTSGVPNLGYAHGRRCGGSGVATTPPSCRKTGYLFSKIWMNYSNIHSLVNSELEKSQIVTSAPS